MRLRATIEQSEVSRVRAENNLRELVTAMQAGTDPRSSDHRGLDRGGGGGGGYGNINGMNGHVGYNSVAALLPRDDAWTPPPPQQNSRISYPGGRLPPVRAEEVMSSGRASIEGGGGGKPHPPARRSGEGVARGKDNFHRGRYS